MVNIESVHIKGLAKTVGFDLCGVARCEKLTFNNNALNSWLEKGYDSSLEYMSRNVDKRCDVRLMVEGAKTVIVCAVSYKSVVSDGYAEDDGCKIASYACNKDYHKTIKKMLKQLLKELKVKYPTLNGRVFVDSAPIFEKQYAVNAGLGWIGRQSLLITPEYGSYVLLGELVVDAYADNYDQPLQGVGCGECRRCMEACPNGAIVAPMTINTSRCISCHTIEQQPTSEIDLHGWIFGCDECQSCCPYNQKAAYHNNTLFDPIFNPRDISPTDWAAMSAKEFEARMGTTPLKRSGLERIKMNIKK
ncbi:MAG: tRNA epoxyqueuosine(34) reductase QueG [Alistipes sp.]|nr:tRNA epoxyqueuosine(34) reductase QueG [Alistipes sp.]